ncbi:MAG: hypothetical protein PHU51_02635 [Candidatus Nanoarchaeia archaeon]|nr:hypothetical protein [Candidatus Nanoarchaeia archaeon]
MNETIYDKLRKVNELVKKTFPNLDEKTLFRYSSKLATWHYPKKRSKTTILSSEEVALYELYLNNNYNPSTIYKWMLAGNCTESVQKKLMKGSIGLRKALSLPKPFKATNPIEQELMYQIKVCINKYVIR